jgi:large subunit ribosomal protein L25
MKFPAQTRDKSIRLDKIRLDGRVPAVVYGNGRESTMISLDHTEFVKFFKIAGETTVIDLDISGVGIVPVLVHEIAYDPRTHKLQHVDFLAIDVKSVVTVGIPVEYIGDSPAVRAGLGVLNTLVDELEIEVLPTEIPQKLEVDITGLENLGDAIRVKDILALLPKSAQPVQDGEVTMCVIGALQAEVEEAPTEIDFDAIEVVEKGKKEDEE